MSRGGDCDGEDERRQGARFNALSAGDKQAILDFLRSP